MHRSALIAAGAAGLILLGAAPGPARTPAPPPAAAPWQWPAVQSDLAPDPRVTWGRLPNGLRYAILPNAEPKDRISLRLLVAAGSLHERAVEKGLAHFVEHMVFRGTQRHPGDTLARELERNGLGMGPDNTAFTAYDHTIYHLEAPHAREPALRQCLEALREYAGEATFDSREIKRERGVVLSEMATRANSGFYADCANTAFLWPLSRRALHVPIGEADQIRAFKRAQLVAFYDAWYRPERMAVIVVGDVAPDAVERLIREVFGPLAGRGTPREESSEMEPAAVSVPSVVIHTDPTQSGIAYLFEHPEPFPRQPDTHALRVDALRRELAFAMFQARLERYAIQFPGTFVAPRASVSYDVPGWRVATLMAVGRMSDWREMAMALEQEHRRAFQRGFTDDELRIARVNWINAYDEAVRAAATRPSDWLANALAMSLLYGRIFTTPEALRDDLTGVVAATTARECTAAFRQTWGSGSLHVFVTTHTGFPFTPERIAALLNESRERDARELTRVSTGTFAYSDFGPPGALARDEIVADLDVHLAEFANGVRVNFKPTPFVADWVQFRVRIGTGKLAQPAAQPGIDLMAGAALPAGGLGKHTRQDLDDLLAGHSVQVRFNVITDACVFDGTCARRDLPTALQLVTAYLTDAAYRPAAMDDVRARFSAMYATIGESASWPIAVHAERVLAAGDRRFGTPAPDELFAHDMAAVSGWLGPQFRNGPIEMSIVGDIGWDEARGVVARTLGALPPRPPPPVAADPGVHCAAPDGKPLAFSTAPTLQQVALALAWPVSEPVDIRLHRRCSLLAAVVAERLRERVRQELGAAYAPAAAFYDHPGFPRFDYFLAYAEVLPAHARAAGRLFRESVEAVRKNPLTPGEFARIQQPLLRALDDERRTNGYWCVTVLSDAQQHPERLPAARDRSADYASITPAEIQALAQRYLDPDRAFFFTATPAATSHP